MSQVSRPGSGDFLTDLEAQVVLALADGRSIRQIAHDVGVSEGAVSMRLYRLSIRIGTHTTVHTVVECLKRGLVRLPLPGGDPSVPVRPSA